MNTQKVITVITIALVLALPGGRLAADVCVPDDYATIQAAINAVSPGTKIKVCEGTYTLTSEISVNKVVTLEGGYDSATCSTRDLCNNETIIDGDDSYRCLNITAVATIDGFTITAGSVDGNGQGIYCNADAIISNCLLQHFDDNLSDLGGGIYNYDCSPVIDGCVFYDCDADVGGAIYNYLGSPKIKNCVFNECDTDKDGGAIYNSDYSVPEINNCTFYQNSAGGSYDGGAIYNNVDTEGQIINCIIWDNQDEIYDDDSDCSITYCCIEGGWPGDDNIGDNPNFSNTSNLDGNDNCWGTCDDGLSLSSNSPCIDAGTGCPGGTDICGSTRCDNSTVDMGAYEYSS